MKTKDAIAHFGNKAAVATALGVSRAAVTQWGDLVPPATAAFLEKLTGGDLRFDPLIYRHQRGRLWTPAQHTA